MRVISLGLFVIANAINVMGCRPAPCGEGCTRLDLQTTKPQVVEHQCTAVDERVPVFINSCQTVSNVKTTGPCAAGDFSDVLCTGVGKCTVERDISTSSFQCECADTCSPYTIQTRRCPASQCYNSGTCECIDNQTVNCLVDPCQVNECADGYKCVSDFCGGCNHRCVKTSTPPPPTPAPTKEPEPIICCLAFPTCPEGYAQYGNYNTCPPVAKFFGLCREESLCCSQIACWRQFGNNN